MAQEPQHDEHTTSAQMKFEYAWRYFAYHAKQRVTMFNFFLVGSGIIGNAYGLLLRGESHLQAGGIALIGFLVCAVFLMLDVRNHQLVRLGEDALRRVEQDYLLSSEQAKSDHELPEYAIMSREPKVGEPSRWFKHGTLIRLLEGAAACGFFVAAVHSLYIELRT